MQAMNTHDAHSLKPVESSKEEKTLSTQAHLEQARKRGRGLLADEATFQVPEELQQASLAARDGIVLVVSLWAVLFGAGLVDHALPVLVCAAGVFALYAGIFSGLSVESQLRTWVSELRRERDEIRENPEMEREEVRALYEAKGFSGPMLDEIVDTLCADEDRLLKLMLEEELGIFFERQNHPVIVGVITGGASLVAALSTALLASFLTPWGTALAAAGLIFIAVVFRTGSLRLTAFELWMRWALAGGFVAGVGYCLAGLLKGGLPS